MASVRPEMDYSHPGLLFGSTDPGFMLFTLSPTTAEYKMIDADGRLLYTYSQPALR